MTKKADFIERESRLIEENLFLKERVGELESIVEVLQIKLNHFEESLKTARETLVKPSVSLSPNSKRLSIKRSLSTCDEESRIHGDAVALNVIKPVHSPSISAVYGHIEKFNESNPSKKAKHIEPSEAVPPGARAFNLSTMLLSTHD